MTLTNTKQMHGSIKGCKRQMKVTSNGEYKKKDGLKDSVCPGCNASIYFDAGGLMAAIF